MELTLEWAADDEEKQLWLIEQREAEDRKAERPPRGRLLLVDLPPRGAVSSLSELDKALSDRFTAHPFANQLPGAIEIVEAALAAKIPPADVVRVSARNLCPAGVARAFGSALERPGGVDGLRNLARACQVLRLGTLDCHAAEGASTYEERAKKWLEGIPDYPEGKPESANHEELCRAYDRQLSAYLRTVAGCVRTALDLPPDKLDAAWEVTLPRGEWTPQQAIAKLEEEFPKARRFWAGVLAETLRELHGQSLESVRGPLTTVLRGKCLVPPSDEKAIATVEAELTHGRFVFACLDALLATDRDLTAQIREQARKAEAEKHAQAVAAAQPTESELQALAADPVEAPVGLFGRIGKWFKR